MGVINATLPEAWRALSELAKTDSAAALLLMHSVTGYGHPTPESLQRAYEGCAPELRARWTAKIIENRG